MSKIEETRDVLLDAIKSTTEGIVSGYTASNRLGALKILAQSYRAVVGGEQPLTEAEESGSKK
jgi:hypothetical protein